MKVVTCAWFPFGNRHLLCSWRNRNKNRMKSRKQNLHSFTVKLFQWIEWMSWNISAAEINHNLSEYNTFKLFLSKKDRFRDWWLLHVTPLTAEMGENCFLEELKTFYTFFLHSIDKCRLMTTNQWYFFFKISGMSIRTVKRGHFLSLK